jgi:uncharacterized protein (TIGR03435 family)
MDTSIDFVKTFRTVAAIVAIAAVSLLFGKPQQSNGQELRSSDGALLRRNRSFIRSELPSIQGGSVVATAVTLRDLIWYAYSFGEPIMGLPPWATLYRYDLSETAKDSTSLTTPQARRLIQSLLADRFRLKLHRENYEAAFQSLVVADGGPRFSRSPPNANGDLTVTAGSKGMIHIEASKASMQQLSHQLSSIAGSPIFDHTGLSGYFSFTLDWSGADSTSPVGGETSSLTTALQDQLGLTLRPLPVKTERLVIDRVDRPIEY